MKCEAMKLRFPFQFGNRRNHGSWRSVRPQNVFQTHRKIVVNNHFVPTDPLSWAHAIAWAYVIATCTVLDDKIRLIKFNDRFGTLDNAIQRDQIDLYSLT